MYLHSISSDVPNTAYTQEECFEILQNSEAFFALSTRSQLLLEKLLLGDSGLHKRHIAVNDIDKVFGYNGGKLNQIFEQEAPLLASNALNRVLDQAGIKADELDALFVCTCTGYLCPGISSYVAEKTGMRSNAFLQDIVGLGCGAAIPMMRSASHMVSAAPKALIACIAVEVCSAAFYMDNDPGVLVSMCLFGDGASAMLFSGEPENAYCRMHDFDTLHIPEKRESLRFQNVDGKLKNRLLPSVPSDAAEAVSVIFNRRKHLGIPKIITHGGGPNVLDALAIALGVEDFPEAREILREYGNLSSPSVLFSLERYLKQNQWKITQPVWMTTFGAGFSCHSCELSSV